MNYRYYQRLNNFGTFSWITDESFMIINITFERCHNDRSPPPKNVIPNALSWQAVAERRQVL